jgi:dienelactone hydrolase
MTPAVTRRSVLAAVLGASAAAAIGPRPAAAADPARAILPPPTGPCPVGTVPLHLVDASQPDPVRGPAYHRELMASVWYPARDAMRYPRAPWMLPAPLQALLLSAEFPADVIVSPLTAAHTGAPVRPQHGRYPVVVFSHGAHDQRADTTIIVQELASHGYVVVTVDHTNDAISQFPDGRLTLPDEDGPGLVPSDFARDIRFILDRVEDLAAGRNPDVDQRPLPAGLHDAIDPHRIGMYGYSKGGTATALTMIDDPRVRAGLSLDGPMECQPPISTELNRPFLMMTAEFTRAADPSAEAFWSLLTGPRLNIQIDTALEVSFTDYETLIPQIGKLTGMSDADLAGWIGTADPSRMVRVQQAYPLAFFDRYLRRRPSLLLDGPSPAFPEVRFIR